MFTPSDSEESSSGASKRALLVYNSSAGLRHAGCPVGLITEKLEQWGWTVSVLHCRADHTTADVSAALEAGLDLVVGAGGDGTLNLIANALAGSGVPLAILPCGTANDLALTLGIPGDLDAALRLIEEGHAQPIDLGIANGRYFLNVASLGVSARVAHSVRSESKRRWGKWAYVFEFARQLRGRRPEPLQICVGGQCEQLDAYQLSVANGVSFGGGWRVSEHASPSDGLLDVVVIEPGRHSLRHPASSGRPTPIERIADRTFRTPVLDVRARHTLLANVDGEPLRFKPPVHFRVEPEALRVLMP